MPEKIHVGIQERWWLLRHLNPQVIDVQLSQVNEQRSAANREALVYFIPHQYAKEAFYKKESGKAYNKMVKENNDLRSTLHYYLFIKATEADVSALVSGEWNRASRLRLTMCRSRNGEPLWFNLKRQCNTRLASLMFGVVFLTLQGEGFIYYPCYLAWPFLLLHKDKYGRIIVNNLKNTHAS